MQDVLPMFEVEVLAVKLVLVEQIGIAAVQHAVFPAGILGGLEAAEAVHNELH